MNYHPNVIKEIESICSRMPFKNLFEYKYRNRNLGCGQRREPNCKSKSMKKYTVLVPFVFALSLASAQQSGFGFDLGIATSKAPMIAAKYYFQKNAVSIGGTYTLFNDALGEKKDQIQPGDKVVGDGKTFYTIDIGYTRVLSEKFSVEGELSIGEKKYYQNINDDNSSSGAYHVFGFKDSKSIVGGGAFLYYNANEIFGLFAGYNSVRGGTLGVELRLFKQAQY